MNHREIKTIISRVEKLMTTRRKLTQESTAIEQEGQKTLNDMAKACSPYKKGQMFKKRGSVIWAKVTEVDATKMKYNRIDPAYLQPLTNWFASDATLRAKPKKISGFL